MGLSVFCVLLVPSVGAAQTVEPSTGLAVFDVEGERLGSVVGVWSPSAPGSVLGGLPNGGVWFSMKVNDTTVLLGVDQNSELYGTEVDELYFESVDCTSTPLFRNSFLNSLFLQSGTVVGGPNPGQTGGGGDNIVYVPDPNDTPTFVTTLARTDGGLKSELCDDLGAPPTIEVINSLALIDIDAVFTRPLHVGEDVAPKKGQGPKK